MPVDVDDSRPQVPDALQRQLSEVFGCDSATVGREHELDGVGLGCSSETFEGQRIRFKIAPGMSEIISTTEASRSVGDFASGTVLNSLLGSAIIRITNPDAKFGAIILDMHDQVMDSDSQYGLHHPSRTSESGVVQTGGLVGCSISTSMLCESFHLRQPDLITNAESHELRRDH